MNANSVSLSSISLRRVAMKLLYDNIGFVYVSERIEASILMCTMRRHRFHVVPLGRWAAFSLSLALSLFLLCMDCYKDHTQ